MEDSVTVEQSRQQANKREAEDRAVSERRLATRHEKVRQAWVEHYKRLALRHHDLAAENAAKADALMEGAA